jgi:hypothetical protein
MQNMLNNMQNMQNVYPFRRMNTPFPYEHTLHRMHNMAEYDKKYAESEHTPKKNAKKLKN